MSFLFYLSLDAILRIKLCLSVPLSVNKAPTWGPIYHALHVPYKTLGALQPVFLWILLFLFFWALRILFLANRNIYVTSLSKPCGSTYISFPRFRDYSLAVLRLARIKDNKVENLVVSLIEHLNAARAFFKKIGHNSRFHLQKILPLYHPHIDENVPPLHFSRVGMIKGSSYTWYV